MSGQDWIALGVVGVAVAYAGRSLWKTLHGETNCASGCGCSKADSAIPSDRKLKQIPLVTIGGVSESSPDGSRRVKIDPSESKS